jgi:hypothetical protein
MYVNLGTELRHSLEVKAPRDLQWPRPLPDQDRLERLVKSTLRETRGQIRPESGGVVIIGASSTDRGFRGAIETAINNLIDQEMVSTRVSAIAVVIIQLNPRAVAGEVAGSVTIGSGAEIFTKVNPRYAGPGRIALS